MARSGAGTTASLPRHNVNHLFLGKTKAFSKAGKIVIESAMVKDEVPAIVCKTSIVDGDQHATPEPVHGGPNRVVHHIPEENYGILASALQAAAHEFDASVLRPGCLGENVSTTGLSAKDVCVGDIIRAGTALLEVGRPLQPDSDVW